MSLNQTGNSQLLDVDPSTQWQWHEAHRDQAKNMYRTSYTDMTHGREVTVKSDYPIGYGGHVRSTRFEVLHRNTQFDRDMVLKSHDPSRDAHPSFKDQKCGVPTLCTKPCGAKKNPTWKVVPTDGTTAPLAPWACLRPLQPLPTHRTVPTTLKRTRSMPNQFGSSSGFMGNTAGQRSALAGSGAAIAAPGMGASPSAPYLATSPTNRVMDTVSMANQEAMNLKDFTEREMLNQEMFNNQ